MISLDDLENTFNFSIKEYGENKIDLDNEDLTMIITIGSKKINYSVSDNFVNLSEAPFIHNDNVYVPLRNVMEYFYHNVDYDKKTNSVILSDVFRLDEIVDIKNNYKVARPKTTYGYVKESKGEKFFTMITEAFFHYEDRVLIQKKLTEPVDFYYTFGREYNASLNSYLDELKIKNNAKYKKLSDDSYIITYDEYFDESKFEGVAAYNMNLGLNNSYNKNNTLSKNMIFIKQEKDSILFSSIKSDEYYL